MFEKIRIKWVSSRVVSRLQAESRINSLEAKEMLATLYNSKNLTIASNRMRTADESAYSAVSFLCTLCFFLGNRGHDVGVPYDHWFQASKTAIVLLGYSMDDAEVLATEMLEDFESQVNGVPNDKDEGLIIENMTDHDCRLIAVDNKAWVKSHLPNLNEKSVDETLEYVRKNHPLRGCARKDMPVLNGNEDIESLAKLADAVTVSCYVALGYRNDFDNAEFEQWNQTAVGNLAFIAISHPDANVREKGTKTLAAWREYMLSTSEG